MFRSQTVAAYRLPRPDETATGPIAGITLALPFSLVLWAIVFIAARLIF